MAKRVKINLFEEVLTGTSGISNPYMDSATKSKVDFQDRDNGNHLLLEGSGFKVSHGMVNSGRIDTLKHFNDDGEMFMTFRNLNIDAKTVAGATSLEFLTDLVQRIVNRDAKVVGTKESDTGGYLSGFNGDDIVVGRSGDDHVSGSRGDDLLIGGAGSDTFFFTTGDGRDRVKDFDSDGGPGAQDFIDADFASVESITQAGKNTVINFGDGDVLTLLGVDADTVTNADFV